MACCIWSSRSVLCEAGRAEKYIEDKIFNPVLVVEVQREPFTVDIWNQKQESNHQVLFICPYLALFITSNVFLSKRAYPQIL